MCPFAVATSLVGAWLSVLGPAHDLSYVSSPTALSTTVCSESGPPRCKLVTCCISGEADVAVVAWGAADSGGTCSSACTE